VAEATTAGTTVAAIARRHGVSRGLVYTWRRELGEVDLPDLVPVVVESPTDSRESAPSPPVRRGRTGAHAALEAAGSIEIALAGDVRVMLRGRVDVKGLRAVLSALRSS
jgi:transposase